MTRPRIEDQLDIMARAHKPLRQLTDPFSEVSQRVAVPAHQQNGDVPRDAAIPAGRADLFLQLENIAIAGNGQIEPAERVVVVLVNKAVVAAEPVVFGAVWRKYTVEPPCRIPCKRSIVRFGAELSPLCLRKCPPPRQKTSLDGTAGAEEGHCGKLFAISGAIGPC